MVVVVVNLLHHTGLVWVVRDRFVVVTAAAVKIFFFIHSRTHKHRRATTSSKRERELKLGDETIL